MAVFTGIGGDGGQVAVGGMRPGSCAAPIPGFCRGRVAGSAPAGRVMAGGAECAVGAVGHEEIPVLGIVRIVTRGALHVAAGVHMHAPGRGGAFQLAIRGHQRGVIEK